MVVTWTLLEEEKVEHAKVITFLDKFYQVTPLASTIDINNQLIHWLSWHWQSCMYVNSGVAYIVFTAVTKYNENA